MTTLRPRARRYRLARLAVAALGVGLAIPAISAAPAAAADSGIGVRPFGSAAALGAPGTSLNAPVVGIAAHPTSPGYWLLGRDGGVFTYGAARFYGSTGGLQLNRPVVAISATATGRGYYLVGEDGGVFTFGDARFFGSTGAIRLAQPIVGVAVTPTGNGYWLVARDGGVFAFGDAGFHGSTGGLFTGTSIVGIAPSPSGGGYVLAGANGTAFSFGDAPTFATARPMALAQPVVDLELTHSGRGAWLLAADGAVFTHGDAAYYGGANDAPRTGLALARTPGGGGYWIAVGDTGPPVPATSGNGRRIVYSNSMQRIWLVEANGTVFRSFLVSGRTGAPPPGTYSIQSRSEMSSAGSLRLPFMQRFYHSSSGKWIGFHGIPLRPDGSPIQTDAQLGTPRSHGCVRMNQQAVKVVWDWAPMGTPVVVLP